MANLESQVAVLTERIDTMEERAQAREELQTSMAADITSIKTKLEKQASFVGGILFVFTTLSTLMYYLAGPILKLFHKNG